MRTLELKCIGNLFVQSAELRERILELEAANAELTRERDAAVAECDGRRKVSERYTIAMRQNVVLLRGPVDIGNEISCANRADAFDDALRIFDNIENNVGVNDPEPLI